MDALTLKEECKLSDKILDEVYRVLWHKTTQGAKPRNSQCHLLVGYHGLYNSNKANAIAEKEGIIKLNIDALIQVHPYGNLLMASHPNLCTEALQEDLTILANRLLMDLINEGYDFVVEDDLANPYATLDKLKLLGMKGYDIDCQIDRKHILRRQLEILRTWAIGVVTKVKHDKPKSIQVPASFYIQEFSRVANANLLIIDHFMVISNRHTTDSSWGWFIHCFEDAFYQELLKVENFIKRHSDSFSAEEYQEISGRLKIIEDMYYSELNMDLLVEEIQR